MSQILFHIQCIISIIIRFCGYQDHMEYYVKPVWSTDVIQKKNDNINTDQLTLQHHEMEEVRYCHCEQEIPLLVEVHFRQSGQ